MTSPDDGRVIEANGISLYVEEHGDGVPVLLLHGWPDSARLWRHQVPVLAASGYRVITPDMRGFGRSERPAEVRSYGLRNVVGDVSALLDGLGVQTAHVVGHDWGAAVAWLTAILCPDRVRTLTVISVPHPLAPPSMRQYEMAWYQLFFQFYGVAEATIQHDDWAWLRTFSRGDGDLEAAIADLSRPGALTASLNWTGPTSRRGRPAAVPLVTGATGLSGRPKTITWVASDEEIRRHRGGAWRYQEFASASHWLPSDMLEKLTELLLRAPWWPDRQSPATTIFGLG